MNGGQNLVIADQEWGDWQSGCIGAPPTLGPKHERTGVPAAI